MQQLNQTLRVLFIEEQSMYHTFEIACINVCIVSHGAIDNDMDGFGSVHICFLRRSTFKNAFEKTIIPFKILNLVSLFRKILSGDKPTDITSEESALILYKVLSSKPHERSAAPELKDMLDSGIFQAVYPLHEGNWHWPGEGALTARQVNQNTVLSSP